MPDFGVSRWASRALVLASVGALACLLGARPVSALPAGWAYELISPVDSLGNDIQFGTGAADGDHAWISAIVPVTSGQSTGNTLSYAAHRTADGWRLRDLGQPGSDWYVLVARSEDGTRSLTTVCNGLLLGCLPGSEKLERVDSDGTHTTMLETTFESGTMSPSVVGVSDDLSHVFIRNFAERSPILPEDTHSSGAGLYESNDEGLEYLGYDENGQVLSCGAVMANDADANLGIGNGFEQNGISSDGSTIAFESPDPQSGCSAPVDVYVRHQGVVIDVSRPVGGGIDRGAAFAGMTRDGDVTFFSTTNRLVPEDVDDLLDVYAYDRTTGSYERITGGLGVAAGPPPQVAISPRGDYVYFKSRKALGGQGVEGAPNLYAYHGGTLRFVATAPSNFLIGGSITDEQATFITPGGEGLLFTSSDALTGQPTGGLVQIFQYRYELDGITCISCPEDGSTPQHETRLTPLNPRGNVNQRHQSDDGNDVAFDTANSLRPEDTNTAVDVYLWRRNLPLALISSGRSEADARFDGMSADGDSVFFESNDRLVPGVEQDNLKLYVARLGGGFPPSAALPRCEDDACQTLLTAPPAFSEVASETLAKRRAASSRDRLDRVVILAIASRHGHNTLQDGRLRVTLRGNGHGRVRIRLDAWLGRWRQSDDVARTFKRAGNLDVTLHLGARARSYLTAHGAVRIRVSASYGSVMKTRRFVVRR